MLIIRNALLAAIFWSCNACINLSLVYADDPKAEKYAIPDGYELSLLSPLIPADRTAMVVGSTPDNNSLILNLKYNSKDHLPAVVLYDLKTQTGAPLGTGFGCITAFDVTDEVHLKPDSDPQGVLIAGLVAPELNGSCAIDKGSFPAVWMNNEWVRLDTSAFKMPDDCQPCYIRPMAFAKENPQWLIGKMVSSGGGRFYGVVIWKYDETTDRYLGSQLIPEYIDELMINDFTGISFDGKQFVLSMMDISADKKLAEQRYQLIKKGHLSSIKDQRPTFTAAFTLNGLNYSKLLPTDYQNWAIALYPPRKSVLIVDRVSNQGTYFNLTSGHLDNSTQFNFEYMPNFFTGRKIAYSDNLQLMVSNTELGFGELMGMATVYQERAANHNKQESLISYLSNECGLQGEPLSRCESGYLKMTHIRGNTGYGDCFDYMNTEKTSYILSMDLSGCPAPFWK